MSSMGRFPLLALAFLSTSAMAGLPATPVAAQTTMEARQTADIAAAVARWETLREAQNLPFESYAGFIERYPGFPQQDRLQIRAEDALDNDPVSTERMVAFFDRFAPLTNSGKARYALALATQNRGGAFEMAREAWRGGTMSGPAEAYLSGLYASRFTADDHAARLDALLWQGDREAAARVAPRVEGAARDIGLARVQLLSGIEPGQPDGALSDAGYVYNLVRHYRTSGQLPRAISLLASRPDFTAPAFDAEAMIGQMLSAAKGASPSQAVRIAARTDDLFPAGYDVSDGSFRLRDDYTSLMWLGGTSALWDMRDGREAAPLFYRYGAAAKTPQTRSKGFYWAGLASQRAGMTEQATRYYELAAAYPERFYGQLALQELGRPVPSLRADGAMPASEAQRREFVNSPLVAATRYVAQGAPWRTGIQFYRALAQQADTAEEHALVAQLARDIGRRDLSVNVAEAAGADAVDGFVVHGFPTLPLPQGANFTLVHAIARQESQFAQNAISHAGARGLMQLMPATAAEEARKAGIRYMQANLIDDAQYNVRLGANHIDRLVARYDGSYPLAFAAYNAGPGNVNKWLRANGDPRTGAISWVEWIERIPFFETKNYVQRVTENAAVYEHLYPERIQGRPRTAGDFLR